MNATPDGQPTRVLDPGEPYQRCMHELRQQHPDYQAAQLYATLSVEEALRALISQLADMTKQLVVASKRL
jgi:hypothetical protein